MDTTAALSTSDTPLPKQMTSIQLGLLSTTLAACIITIIINPLTLLALFKQKMITKSSINLFIASLCCSDFLFGIAIYLFQLQKLLQLSPASEHLITILNCIGGILCCVGFFVSNTNALLISFDRAYATLAPFKYKTHMSIKLAYIILVVAWTSATLQAIVPITANIAIEGKTAIFDYPYELFPYSLRLYWLTPLLYFGTATNVGLYVTIVISFLKITKKVQPSNSSSDVRSRRMTRTVTMVIGTLLIGNIPLVTIAACPNKPDVIYLWSYAMFDDIAFFCAILPTFFNNFLYVWQLPDFNRAVRRLLSCRTNEIANLDTATSPARTNPQRYNTV
ncbi:hypothetical protein CAPTEDRAFT_207325 [Capitella teleta]|uniref:G-protein coupled receptors family 1 profile domain-containing protein n=1 Tax=Capitella teleta TaxID=283909 RepID=R7V7B2_CAPTE|nr:hypothetical protein CAPTEDRAFT_207325 [Capitella teleta]|eukprot:ELU14733.1 hypothetical protein CAPTEDRAFT_207325 [Capitella teleta]